MPEEEHPPSLTYIDVDGRWCTFHDAWEMRRVLDNLQAEYCQHWETGHNGGKVNEVPTCVFE